jgi:hypothetical protein
MVAALVILGGFLLGALTYRIRGGLFNTGHPWGRLSFAIPLSVALVLPLGSLGWLAFAGALVATLVAVYFINNLGHGTYMDLGRNPNGHLDDPEVPISYLIGPEKRVWDRRQRFRHNFLGLLIKGAALGILVGAPLAFLSGDPSYLAFVVTGASMPVCYLVAWNIPLRIEAFEQGPPLGEAIYGGVLGATAVLPLVLGSL